jgi:regulator of protease activity HflC (stomatin/prohibitin superfamily)
VTPAPAERRRRRWRRRPFVSIGIQLLALILVFFWDRIFIVIHSGEAGVLWNRFAGTQVDWVYGEGLHIISPLDRMSVYEVRKQVAVHQLDVLSVDGLRLHLDLAIRYRPAYDLLGMLQERIGPDYLIRVVIPQTESVLRKELGTASAEQIYTDDNGLLTRAMVQAMREAGRNFVELEDILIRRIQLPETVRTAIEQKLTQQQLLKSYRFRLQSAEQEAERLRIEAGGIHDYQRIVDETLTEQLLTHQGIMATRDIARSENAKTVVIGAGEVGVPIIIGGVDSTRALTEQTDVRRAAGSGVGADAVRAPIPPTEPAR